MYRQANSVEDETVEEADVGGIWMIGNINATGPEEEQKEVEAPPGLDPTWTRVGGRSRSDKTKVRLIDWKKGSEHECHDGCCRSRGGNTFEALADDSEDNEEGAECNGVEWKMFRSSKVDVGAVGATSTKPRMSRESKMRFNVARVQKPLASAAKVVEAGNRISMGPDPEDNYIENGKTGEKIGLRVERGTYVFDVEFKDGEAGTITLDSGAGVNVWPEHIQKDIPMLPKDPRLRMTAANGSDIQNLGMKMIEFRGVESGFRRRV